MKSDFERELEKIITPAIRITISQEINPVVDDSQKITKKNRSSIHHKNLQQYWAKIIKKAYKKASQ